MKIFSAGLAANRRLWLRLGVGGLIVLSAAATVWWSWSQPRLNVILVTLDTTRADRLGAYGYKSGVTSAFDEFAKRGVLFESAYAPAPVTLPSHATMLTGLYPPEHGLRLNGAGRLAGEIPLLPEILKKHDYDTGAFIAAAVLDSQYGLERGFDVYDDQVGRSARHFGEPRRDGRDVVDAALAWLRQRTTRPFFCWIHLFDAHAPYDPRPEVFQQKFAQNPYDAGIAWQDSQFGRVLAFLKERQLDSRTIVVVAGDHGEGLDDHLEVEHGMLLYNTTVRVPLAFASPRNCRPGTRVSQSVSLVDLMPTVLELLDVPSPKTISGQSLKPGLKGQVLDARPLYAETETPFVLNGWSPLQAVMTDRWKYIQTTRPELYDLSDDPGEMTNLAESNEAETRDMRNLLKSVQERLIAAKAGRVSLSDKDRANLRSLGYVSSGSSGDSRPLANEARRLPDVKDFLPLLATFERAKHIGLEGNVADAITLLQEITQATTEFPSADLLLADCLAQAGKLDEAVTAYRNVLAKRPDFDRARLSLSRLLAGQGHLKEAEAELRGFVDASPKSAQPHVELAQLLMQRQEIGEAIDEYQVALRLAPDFVPALVGLGQAYAAMRRWNDAAVCFEKILQTDDSSVAAHASLLVVLSQSGRPQDAVRHGLRAAELEPNSFENRMNIGAQLLALGHIDAGISQLQVAQRLRPGDPRPRQLIERAGAATRTRQ